MTVKELIAELKTMPPDMLVVYDGESGHEEVEHVGVENIRLVFRSGKGVVLA